MTNPTIQIKKIAGDVTSESDGSYTNLALGQALQIDSTLVLSTADSKVWLALENQDTESQWIVLSGPGSIETQVITLLKPGAEIDVERIDPSELEPAAAGAPSDAQDRLDSSAFSLSDSEPLFGQATGAELSIAEQTDFQPITLDSANAASNPVNALGSSIENDSLTVSSTPNSSTVRASVTEDFSPIASGEAPAAAEFVPQDSLETTYGKVNIQADGTWEYELDSNLEAVQALGAGQNLSDTFQLQTRSGNTFDIEISVQGSNDLPSISGDFAGEVSEQALFPEVGSPPPNGEPIIATGRLEIEDIDTGESSFIAEQRIEAAYGAASVDSSGQWTYTLDNENAAVQGLAEGERLQDGFLVSSIDGSNQIVEIAINGSNARALFDGNNTAILDISQNLDVTGRLIVNDIDFGESSFQAMSGQIGRFGQFSIEENGSWNYVVNETSAQQALDEKVIIRDSFGVRSADGTLADVIITLKDGSAHDPQDVAVLQDTQTTLIDPEAASIAMPQVVTPEQHAISSSPIDSGNTYYWQLDGEEKAERIADFQFGAEGDKLVIQDILSDTPEDDLSDWLNIHFDGQDSTLSFSSQDEARSESLVFENVDLTALGSNHQEVLYVLQQQGNLELPGLI